MSVPADRRAHDLDALEFHAVRAMLVERLATPLGRIAVDELAPLD
ncbi:MAG: hypothetical protein RIT25_2057, partial [Planctomycetota bacterium]